MTTAAVLTGLGAALPPRVVTNEELARILGVTDEWIHRRTGIRQRHVCDPGTATSDLAIEAGARALASAGVAEVGAVVLATSTPDSPVPAAATRVAAGLGLGSVPAFDLNAVCAGYVHALAVSSSLITGGLYESVLVVGADTFSTVVAPDDVNVRPLFGDGAGAMVLTAGQDSDPGALGRFDLGADGTGTELAHIPGGGSRQRAGARPGDPEQMYLRMQGREVFVRAVEHMTASSRVVLARSGLDTTAVDRLVGHQANIRILRMVAGRLALPGESLISNIERVGNTSAASIPLAAADAVLDGTLQPGHLTLFTAFGAGLSWGSTVLRWPKITVDEWR